MSVKGTMLADITGICLVDVRNVDPNEDISRWLAHQEGREEGRRSLKRMRVRDALKDWEKKSGWIRGN